MSVLSLLTFSLPVLMGTLIAHLLWMDKNNPIEMLFKLSLGTGLGLGISSLQYFTYLVFFAGSPYFLYAELALFFMILAVVYFKYKMTTHVRAPHLKMSLLQIVLLLIAGVVFVSSFLGMAAYSRQRAHGDWDAWMIFNRSARFIYRGQENWQDAFSQDMNVMFHADYPPLLALNIASRWDILNKETTYVPMFLGFLFSLASLGLCFGALARLKSPGQGALSLILLGGTGLFLGEGGRQTADVPLAFYVLASVTFLFFYYHEKRALLMAFAGFMAGLAAWTKNEGIFFLFASAGVLSIASLGKRSLRDLLLYGAGSLIPLILLFHFKSQIAPSSEFLSGGFDSISQYLVDITRHQLIFGAFKGFFLHGGGWYHIGIYLILAVYFLLFKSHIRDKSGVILISFAILAIQVMGYYGFYLISPYDLEWHVTYSLNRLFVHIYPATVFVVMAATQPPETIFSSSHDT
jgi:hypothetical protein